MMHRCSITQRGAGMVLQCTCSLLFVGTSAEAERLRRAHVARMRELEGIYAASISRAHGRAREAREAEMVAAMAAETRTQVEEAQRGQKLMDVERQLCERLGIATLYEVCECGCLDSAHWKTGCECRSMCGCTGLRIARKAYPEISRSGRGMLALVDAIQSRGLPWGAEDLQEGRGVEAFCALESREDFATAFAPTLPLALALAVAKAFGIEVPR